MLVEEDAYPVLIGRREEDKAAAKHNTILYLAKKSGLQGRGAILHSHICLQYSNIMKRKGALCNYQHLLTINFLSY